jgi:hypothetical protein
MWSHVNVGDTVSRSLSGQAHMKLRVTDVDAQHIYCGPWKFLRSNGAEIDEELGWGQVVNGEMWTGSYLVSVAPAGNPAGNPVHDFFAEILKEIK